jgi:hypothetical protein
MTNDKLRRLNSIGWNATSNLSFGICHLSFLTSLRRVDLFLHLECASDQADLLLRLRYNLDDVETKRDVGEVEQAEPFFGGANDSGSLAPIDCFVRCPEKLIRTSFDFNKNQNLFLTIAANEVNLAATARPEVSIEDLEGLFP